VADKPYLLDTSALLAWIEGEEGAERVANLLRNAEVLLPWVALVETYYITEQERGETLAMQRFASLTRLPVRILNDLGESGLLTAGRLKARYRMSFADTIVAAYAILEDAILVHKDPEYNILIDRVQLEALPYK